MRIFATVIFVMAALIVATGVSFGAGGSYRIGDGDVLSVTIFANGEAQEELELAVASDGTIRFPFLGAVRASGLSVAELVAAVTKPLANDYFVNPQVIIRVLEFKSQNVYVTGAVTKPGLYPLERDMKVIELIAQAGGVSEDRGNFVYIIKGSAAAAQKDGAITQLIDSQPSVKVDLLKLLQGDAGSNIPVTAGDVIYVQPSSLSNASQLKVYILGYVEEPGAFAYQEGLTVLDACAMAGGFKKYAAPGRTTVTRRSGGSETIIKIDLEDVNDGKKQDLALEPGDRIFVPRSWF